ncbi:MAG TPA: ABC transporter substrate-binding protein [Pseudonocardiaceae bacterium]|jgi:branched-chain amino acid transport system substrate-binding protein|nr:ABC transporter substrate-binding protein [Pseudonocardiaceae bacterium]
MDTVIGVVAHGTGRLAALGTPLRFAAQAYEDGAARRGGGRPTVSIRDSRSTPDGAADAVRRLVEDERAALILTLGGTATVPAVARACAEVGVPCLSTTLPWQVLGERRGLGFHACWGLDDIAAAFASAWARVPGIDALGCLWNAGPQGAALRSAESGFAAQAARLGLRLVDPGGYAEDSADFRREAGVFAEAGVRVVTSAATARDLRGFHRRALRAGLRLALISCSRWLSYPIGARESGVDGVVTPVYWTPRHPYTSSLDGSSCAELAAGYTTATGQGWLQPLGMAHALFEVAQHALDNADEPEAIAKVLAETRLATIAGTLDWSDGPAQGVARVPLATGQWQRAGDAVELAVVANEHVPAASVEADLRVSC